MAMPTDIGLGDAWRSLAGRSRDPGWRVISLGQMGACLLHAGRRFPGNAEALLVGFPGVRLPAARQLPQGRGFEVARVDMPGTAAPATTTVALVREPAGSLELFETMAQDVTGALRRESHLGIEGLLEVFLRRVAAWQDFMRRPGDQRLSYEEEVGLYGELLMLEQMIDAGGPPVDMVEAWEGPLDGLQDFVIGGGAIEVKSSIAVTGFPASIGCLEQLDDSVRQPLYLAAQRIALVPDGVTLPGLVDKLRAKLEESGAAGVFELRMKQAGYLDEHAPAYTRSFAAAGERIFLVNQKFPRLTPFIVGSAIRSAIYSIDVDQLDADPVPLHLALQSLEII
jgi:hypothetical protein